MARVRARPESGNLYLDFFYRGIRCREQTTLPDTAENRRKVEALLKRIVRDIRQGIFNYAETFPGSARAERFAAENGNVPMSARVADMEATPQETHPTPSFADFAELWFTEMLPQWRRSHQQGVRDVLDKYLLPRFGPQDIRVVARSDVLAFRSDLSQHRGRRGRLGAGRINKIMCFLRQILNEAADRFDFPSAFRGVKSLKQKRTDVEPFSLDEVERIRSTIRPDFRDYVTVRFFTGMRTGEINGLKWEYVDFERGTILVRETLVGGELEADAKNASSLRDIPMLPQVRAALERRWAEKTEDSPLVFTSPRGGPVDAHNFTNRVWYPLLRYLDLKKRRPYQTRHTTATLMLAAGENPEWIARVMGHTTTQMLFTVYSRFVPNLTRQDGRAFTGVLNAAIAPEARESTEMPDLDALSDAEIRQMLSNLLAKH